MRWGEVWLWLDESAQTAWLLEAAGLLGAS
jgi:hypothetical protein